MKKPSPKKALTQREFATAMGYYARSFGKEAPPVPPKRELKRTDIPTEHQLQVKVVAWWNKWHGEFGLPVFALYAVPSGGLRDVIIAARMKSEGVRRGYPDLQMDVPRGGFHGLRIEMKRIKGGSVSPEQKEVHQFLREQGYSVAVCRGNDEAIAVIKDYLTIGE